MIAYVPLYPNAKVEEDVVKPLFASPYINKIIPVYGDKHYIRHHPKRAQEIANTRMQIFELAKRRFDNYFLMVNNTFRHKKNNHLNDKKCIPTMIKYLDENIDCGACRYQPNAVKLNYGHIGTELMLIRTISIKNIILNVTSCDCNAFCSELRKQNWKVCYVK